MESKSVIMPNWGWSKKTAGVVGSCSYVADYVIMLHIRLSIYMHRPNYRLFVPKTFRSQERKVPMANFRSPGTKVPGTFVPGTFRSRGTKVSWNFRSRALSFSGTFVPRERKFLGTFIPRDLSYQGTFVPIIR